MRGLLLPIALLSLLSPASFLHRGSSTASTLSTHHRHSRRTTRQHMLECYDGCYYSYFHNKQVRRRQCWRCI